MKSAADRSAGTEALWSLGRYRLAWHGGRLRRWRHDDASRLVTAWHDVDIAGYNPVPDDPTLETAVRWIAREAERGDQRRSIDLVIVADDDQVLGEVGLSGFSEKHRGALIGYWLLREARGKGMARAAVTVFTAWAHDVLDLDLIVARCHQSNLASQRVAAGAGFRHEADEPSGHQLWRSRPLVS